LSKRFTMMDVQMKTAPETRACPARRRPV